MAELTLDDAARILNEKCHKGIGNGNHIGNRWVVGEIHGVRFLDTTHAGSSYSAFEARAIAREYLRLDGKLPGPATRDVLDDITSILRAAENVKKVGGNVLVTVRIEDRAAFLAEREND